MKDKHERRKPGIVFRDEKDGFTYVVCPACGKTVATTSWPDDTRRRYSRHLDGGPDGENCDLVDELIQR